MNDLETLKATEDIRRLEARYAFYADQKRWRDLAGLFTEDGLFRPLDEAGHELFRMAGREDIASSLEARNSGDVQPIHQLFTHEIDIESSTSAKGIWAMADLIFRGDSAMPVPGPNDKRLPFRTMRGWGHYHVIYRKVDGQWLIASRTLTRTRLEYTY
jgi:SnoaL-like domain